MRKYHSLDTGIELNLTSGHVSEAELYIDEFYFGLLVDGNFDAKVNYGHFSENPYPGLRPFRTTEFPIFKGRDRHVQHLAEKLKQAKFLAVIGSSGTGKSSLVRAGLIPKLYEGIIPEAGHYWNIAICRPGKDPIANLAVALSSIASEAFDKKQIPEKFRQIKPKLDASSYGILDIQDDIIASKRKNGPLLIIIDQFEELFRYRRNRVYGYPVEKRFVNLLLEASKGKNVYVIITMRSEFLGDTIEYRNLPEAINDGQYLVPKLNRAEVRDAIEGPLELTSHSIDDSLIEVLINELEAEQDAQNHDQLPILQHAMMRTFQHAHKQQSDKLITEEDYKEVGGMAHALDQHAEEIYENLCRLENGLSCSKNQELAKIVFQALTDISVGHKGGRRPTRLEDLYEIISNDKLKTDHPSLDAVIDQFRGEDVNFIVPSTPNKLYGRDILDISHESLMRIWSKLKVWIEEERRSAYLYRQLNLRREMWEKGEDVRIKGVLLEEIQKIFRDYKPLCAAWAGKYHPTIDNKVFNDEIESRIKRLEQEGGKSSIEELRDRAIKERNEEIFVANKKYLEECIAAADESRKRQEKYTNDLRKANDDYRSANEELKQAKFHLQNSYEKLADSTKKIEATNKSLEKSNKSLVEAKRQLEESNRNLEESKNDLNKQKSKLEATNKSLAESNNELTNAKLELETSNKQLQESRNKLNEQKNELASRNLELKKSQTELETTNSKLADTNKDLEKSKRTLTRRSRIILGLFILALGSLIFSIWIGKELSGYHKKEFFAAFKNHDFPKAWSHYSAISEMHFPDLLTKEDSMSRSVLLPFIGEEGEIASDSRHVAVANNEQIVIYPLQGNTAETVQRYSYTNDSILRDESSYKEFSSFDTKLWLTKLASSNATHEWFIRKYQLFVSDADELYNFQKKSPIDTIDNKQAVALVKHPIVNESKNEGVFIVYVKDGRIVQRRLDGPTQYTREVDIEKGDWQRDSTVNKVNFDYSLEDNPSYIIYRGNRQKYVVDLINMHLVKVIPKGWYCRFFDKYLFYSDLANISGQIHYSGVDLSTKTPIKDRYTSAPTGNFNSMNKSKIVSIVFQSIFYSFRDSVQTTIREAGAVEYWRPIPLDSVKYSQNRLSIPMSRSEAFVMNTPASHDYELMFTGKLAPKSDPNVYFAVFRPLRPSKGPNSGYQEQIVIANAGTMKQRRLYFPEDWHVDFAPLQRQNKLFLKLKNARSGRLAIIQLTEDLNERDYLREIFEYDRSQAK